MINKVINGADIIINFLDIEIPKIVFTFGLEHFGIATIFWARMKFPTFQYLQSLKFRNLDDLDDTTLPFCILHGLCKTC